MMIASFQEVHIENTNSCRYKCLMCPRDLLTRRIGFMSLEDFSLVLERIAGFQGVFHLHGFGEALLDRQFSLKVAMLKSRYPGSKALVFSTLGVKLTEEYLASFVESGLDTMVVSFYGFTKEEYQKIHGFDGFSLAQKNLELLSQAMRSSSSPLQVYIKIPGKQVMTTLPIAISSERSRFCQWAQDLGFAVREWSYVHNYSNGRQYNLPNLEKICPVIQGYRKNILNVSWDLQVVPCSYDFNATISWGDLHNKTIEEIFAGEEYLSFLTAHTTQELSAYPICQNCEKNDFID